LESIPGLARLPFNEDGSAEYAGGTDVCWDGQTTVRDKQGQVRLMCASGHEWSASMDETAS
jgi:hypothetical protein